MKLSRSQRAAILCATLIGAPALASTGSSVGTNYCSANPNSTGSPTIISGQGSASVAANDLTLRAEPVPNQPFIVFFGPNQIELPFGNGFRCVGGGVHRVLPPGFASGQVATQRLDLVTLGGGVIVTDSTWNFQVWYRDPAASPSSFNTSNGLSVDFLP